MDSRDSDIVMQQDQTPLLDAIRAFSAGQPAYFCVPAHQMGRGMDAGLIDLFGKRVFAADLTEVEGLDDLHLPTGAIAKAEELAADLWQADDSFFLVNGSTCGIEAMLLACLQPGDKVLLARNVHRSVLSALILSGAEPVWMIPDATLPGGGPITAEQVRLGLQKEPSCKACLLVSPTYYGVGSPLREIAEVCHAKDLPLLVDEAHGCHFYFTNTAPEGALQAGADLVVQSLHKTGGSLTQSSLLHRQGKLVSRQRIRETLSMLMSSSPSYLLLASLDAARRQLAVQGSDLLAQAAAMAKRCRSLLEDLPGISLLPQQADPLRVVFSARERGLSGLFLQQKLYAQGAVSIEMADPEWAVAVLSWGTTEEDLVRLVQTLRNILTEAGEKKMGSQIPMLPVSPKAYSPVSVRTPREAWYAPWEQIPFSEAVGRIAAESLIPYPPGIPCLYPGEEIQDETLQQAGSFAQLGLSIQGVSDTSLHTIRVVQEGVS